MPGPVFLAVDAATADLTADDRVLAGAVTAAGLEAVPIVWGRPLPARATVVVRSTWDYVERPARFRDWLDTLDAGGVEVHNPTPQLRWNMHKGYLLELAGSGVPIVPTVVVARGQQVDLGELMAQRGWDDAVVKPAIGGTARSTSRVSGHGVGATQHELDRMLVDEDVLVQEFVASVPSAGETSVIVIGGVVSHAVDKRAARGEWRVQAEFGGTAELSAVGAALGAAARRVLAAVQPTPLYARVDLVEAAGGELQLMELELVEPELFFRLAPGAAARLAQLLANLRLGRERAGR